MANWKEFIIHTADGHNYTYFAEDAEDAVRRALLYGKKVITAVIPIEEYEPITVTLEYQREIIMREGQEQLNFEHQTIEKIA